MLSPQANDYCRFDPDDKAQLLVVIDTEEEFDWSGQRSRNNTAVHALRKIETVQKIFDEYHITPVYVVDYPVVSHPDGYRPLQEIYQSGRCVIGAHLHPWVNPPFDEPLTPYHSFAGNLPPALETAKLRVLSEKIAERFQCRPTIYKAGRYGVGPHTADILEQEGYEIDLSICPRMNYSQERGPDFSRFSAHPYWFGRQPRLLELPLTVGFAGFLRRWGNAIYQMASRPPWSTLHSIGILARLRCIDRIWLSPEGYCSLEHRRLLRALYRDGLRVFSFAFHSPSVEPGHTPYVRSQQDLQEFLSRCRNFFDFFFGELRGEASTPTELRRRFLSRDQRSSS
jgi:hypothetical protein